MSSRIERTSLSDRPFGSGSRQLTYRLPGTTGHASSQVATTTSAHSTSSVSSSCGMWSRASMPSSSRAATTTWCASLPGLLPAERAECRSPTAARKSRSAITERPLLATQTKRTFMTLGRERAADSETFGHSASRLDRPAGGRDDVLHDCEPEAGAARGPRRVRAVEALEDANAILGPEADAVVGHGERRCVASPRDGDTARAAGAGVADRVRDEVLADDAQHARPERQLDLVAADDFEGDLCMFRPIGERRDDLPQDRDGRRSSERNDLATALELAEKEDVVDELARLVHLLLSLLEERLDLGPRERRSLEEGKEPGERCPELVGDGSGEPGPK